eukprot:CAMPEP_0173129534 /NCGR_PEP_ID=MMETSP1102-20130122/59307_1 /TAXON_ID=49646 /ORGANISM="Geminigera sp., Strain Caron Lab Isolate" /LENGTH=45 /DNA_ID= /DNA_START= /DNA_END= /DNA_ORIENTATION=
MRHIAQMSEDVVMGEAVMGENATQSGRVQGEDGISDTAAGYEGNT